MKFTNVVALSHPVSSTGPVKITAQAIEKIMRAMTAKEINQTHLAEAVGVHRSYISKILKGDLASIPDDLAHKLNEALGIELLPVMCQDGAVSSTALQLSAMAEQDPMMAVVLEALLLVGGGSATNAFLPSVATEDLPTLGETYTRIVMRWEEGDDPHYSKIAAEILTATREYYRSRDAGAVGG